VRCGRVAAAGEQGSAAKWAHAGDGARRAGARALLRAWLDSIGLELDDADLLAWLQSDAFSHGDLLRRARRHERELRAAVARGLRGPRRRLSA
jgi:hypothetical protein